MKHTQFEPNLPSESRQKSVGQVKGLIIILRGMLREKLRTTEINTLPYYEFRAALHIMNGIDSADPDFMLLWDAYLCINDAAYGHPEHMTVFWCCNEIIGAMRPYTMGGAE